MVDHVPASSFDADNLPFEITTYQDVFNAGLEFMQKAITTAENAPDFVIPSGWMGVGEFSKAEFIGLIKTYRAHYRASVPRTPEDRKNVDWQAVIQDIDEGYTEMNGGQIFKIEDTPKEDWFSTIRYYGKNPTWTRGDYKTLGPADITSSYQEWLDSPLNERLPFDITTNDRRITGAGGPQTDGKYFAYAGPSAFRQSRGIYFFSNYKYNRNIATYANYGEGNSKWLFTPAAMRLLKAEALLHLNAQGNKAQVISIINKTRVGVGELNPATMADAIGSMSDSQNALDNASIWSKLKHEKRMESFASVCGLAFFDRRGWGDLVDGTFVDLPIPGEELLILQKPLYTSGVVNVNTE